LRVPLIEFPADDVARACRFWEELLGISLRERAQGYQADVWGPGLLGIHPRGPGPGDTASLAYFEVPDLADALERVVELGGSVIHPGERWAVCRDSEGSPFGLAQR
jgi:predicted enzyme related to lactoylglutathione lyase